MAKWFGAHYNQEVRFNSAVKCKKGHQVLTLLLLSKTKLLLLLLLLFTTIIAALWKFWIFVGFDSVEGFLAWRWCTSIFSTCSSRDPSTSRSSDYRLLCRTSSPSTASSTRVCSGWRSATSQGSTSISHLPSPKRFVATSSKGNSSLADEIFKLPRKIKRYNYL